MPPKKVSNIVDEEICEIKESLNFMSEEISKVVKQQGKLLDLMEEVKQLKILVKEKDRIITGLERRIDDLEQYTRMEDVIISGLETTHRTYASVTEHKDSQNVSTEELKSLERQVVHFFESKNITIQGNNIAACHTLPRKDSKTKPVIVVRFVNRKHKAELLRQSKKLKGTGVYINEHLTKKNADLARQARMLKKQHKIQATWTRNCKIIIRLNGSPEEAKVLTIREMRDLDPYK